MSDNTQPKTEGIPQERITVYAPQQDYRKLKSKLAMIGLTVTEWFRRKLREEITSESLDTHEYPSK